MLQLRTDGRWRKAIQLLEGRVANVERLVRGLDPATEAVVRFKFDYDRGMGHLHPAYDDAASLYFQKSDLRLAVEGGLLCGKAGHDLEPVMGIPADVIDAYHDMFFDVGERLDNDGWISAVVFGGFAHSGADAKNARDIALRTAWIGGWELFYHLIRKGFTEQQEKDLTRMLIESVSCRRASAMVFTAGNYPGSMEFIRTYMAMTADTEDAADGNEAAAEGRELLKAFAERVLGTGRKRDLVADIGDESNLTLPAREKRVADYEEAR